MRIFKREQQHLKPFIFLSFFTQFHLFSFTTTTTTVSNDKQERAFSPNLHFFLIFFHDSLKTIQIKKFELQKSLSI